MNFCNNRQRGILLLPARELQHAVRNLLPILVIHVLEDWISLGLMAMGLRIGWFSVRLFSVDNTPEDFKVRLVVVHFKGKALQWHSAYVRTVGLRNLPSWKDYSQILLDRFGEVCEDPMVELMRLRQKGSVIEFH